MQHLVQAAKWQVLYSEMTAPPLEQIVTALGGQWEQPVFATTNAAYWQDSWRHRCLFRAVRLLRGGALAQAGLVVLAACILVGRWFASPDKSQYVVALSQNNQKAFAELNALLADAEGSGFVANQIRLPVLRRIALLWRSGHLFEAGRVLARQGSQDPQVRATQVFGIACALLFYADLKRSAARVIAVANDHSPPTLALLGVGASLGIPRLYMQHAPVTRYFPPLTVELAVLHDRQAAQAYQAAASRMGLPWQPERCHIQRRLAPPAAPPAALGSQISVCLALSMYPDLTPLRSLVQELRQTGRVRSLSMRPHPRHPHSLASLAAQLQVPVLAATEDLEGLVRETDLFIVSNSGFAIELLQRGAPVFFADALDHQHRDYFGLVQAGLLPELTTPVLASFQQMSDLFTPEWQAKVRAALSREEGDDAALLAQRIQHLMRQPAAAQDAKISVVIPTYNRIDTLPQAIRSAQSQSHPPCEIIVIDDGSTDGSLAMLKADFPEVLTQSLPRKGGACAARNAGIALASGSHIAFLDSDDGFLPDKLKRQLEEMRLMGARFATCGKTQASGRRELTRRLEDRRLATFNFRGGTSGLMAETALMREVRFDPSMLAAQDWELFLRLADHAKGVHVPEALYLYGTRAANRITLSKRRRFLGHVQLYRRHIQGTARDNLRVRIVHFAIQAMLRADLRNHRLCRKAADVVHRLLR